MSRERLSFDEWKKENTCYVLIGSSKKLCFNPTSSTVNKIQLRNLYRNYLAYENHIDSLNSNDKDSNSQNKFNLFPAGNFKKEIK